MNKRNQKKELEHELEKLVRGEGPDWAGYNAEYELVQELKNLERERPEKPKTEPQKQEVSKNE